MTGKRLKGIRRKNDGWEAYIRVKGRLISKVFPRFAHPDTMQYWRESQRTCPSISGSLADDARRYLDTCGHMPDAKNRRMYMRRWIAALGPDRDRRTVTTADLDAIMSSWLTSGLAPTTVRHHRSALLQLWERLDGKGAPNPVRETQRPPDRRPRPRAVPLDHAVRVLSHMEASKTRARLLVMLTTGLPAKQVMQLEPHHWDRLGARLLVAGRSKGRGTTARVMPLSVPAMQALHEFDTAEAWGAFSTSSVYKSVRAACRTLALPFFRPYDLRHAQGTLLYQETGDLTTVARLLGHAGTRTTERYTLDAWDATDRRATTKAGRRLDEKLDKARKHEQKR